MASSYPPPLYFGRGDNSTTTRYTRAVHTAHARTRVHMHTATIINHLFFGRGQNPRLRGTRCTHTHTHTLRTSTHTLTYSHGERDTQPALTHTLIHSVTHARTHARTPSRPTFEPSSADSFCSSRCTHAHKRTQTHKHSPHSHTDTHTHTHTAHIPTHTHTHTHTRNIAKEAGRALRGNFGKYGCVCVGESVCGVVCVSERACACLYAPVSGFVCARSCVCVSE